MFGKKLQIIKELMFVNSIVYIVLCMLRDC
jgi:hypothetical protein